MNRNILQNISLYPEISSRLAFLIGSKYNLVKKLPVENAKLRFWRVKHVDFGNKVERGSGKSSFRRWQQGRWCRMVQASMAATGFSVELTPRLALNYVGMRLWGGEDKSLLRGLNWTDLQIDIFFGSDTEVLCFVVRVRLGWSVLFNWRTHNFGSLSFKRDSLTQQTSPV